MNFDNTVMYHLLDFLFKQKRGCNWYSYILKLPIIALIGVVGVFIAIIADTLIAILDAIF